MIIQLQNWQLVNMQGFLDWMITAWDWSYSIVKRKRARTSDQNRYLRGGVYRSIAKHTGDDEDYIHGVMAMKFLVDNSRKAPYVKSTTELDTKEFGEYIDKIKNFVAEFGIIVPNADEYENFIYNNSNEEISNT